MNWKSLILAAITTTVLILLVAGATGTAPPKNMYWTIVWMYFTIEAWQYWKWKSLLPYFLYLLVIITAGEIMKGSGVEYHSIPVLILLIITNIGGLIIFYILLNKWKSDSVSAKKQIYEKEAITNKVNDIVMNKQKITQINKVSSHEMKTKPIIEHTIDNLNYRDTLPGQDKVAGNFMPRSDNSKPVVTNKITDDFYAQAWDEINDQDKTPDKALWAKSFSVTQGDEKKAQAKYIELRVAQLQEIANREQRQREIAIQEEKQAIINAKIEAMKKNALKSKTYSNDDWESRTLCGDGKCIGIIGSDGRCKECGKTLEETKNDNKDKSPYDADAPIDLSNRVLCSDESCIGIMGPDGICTKCRRLLR